MRKSKFTFYLCWNWLSSNIYNKPELNTERLIYDFVDTLFLLSLKMKINACSSLCFFAQFFATSALFWNAQYEFQISLLSPFQVLAVRNIWITKYYTTTEYFGSRFLDTFQLLCIFVTCNSWYLAPWNFLFCRENLSVVENYCWQETPRIVHITDFPFHSQCGKIHVEDNYIFHSSRFQLDPTEHLFLQSGTMWAPPLTPNTLLHQDRAFSTAVRHTNTNSLKMDERAEFVFLLHVLSTAYAEGSIVIGHFLQKLSAETVEGCKYIVHPECTATLTS